MSKAFTWKPALLQSASTWTLNGAILANTAQSVDLSKVTSAALVDHYPKGQRVSRLDLFVDEDRCASLSITTAPSVPHDDPDHLGFWACVEAVADHLSQRSPAFPVTLGEIGRPASAIFFIGLLTLLGGLGLLGASLAGLAGARGLNATAAPILAMVLFGAAMALYGAPGRRRPQVPISTFGSKPAAK